MQPAETQLEEPKDSREPDVEPPSEPTLDVQPEPTVTFLLTLLNTPEPKDDETDTEVLESQFVDQDDWGPRRTSEEIQLLERDCMRLQESLNASQRENLVLEEKLENLSVSLYEDLENIVIPEESRVTQKTAEDSQGKAEDIQEEAKDIQEKAGVTQEEVRPLGQPKRAP